MKFDLIAGLNADYIPLPSELWGINFFPSINWYFIVTTDDKSVFYCSREKLNGEGIYSCQTGSSFLDYFRRRIGVADGAPISLDQLQHYGRTDVDFYKIDEETYFMDFSI